MLGYLATYLASTAFICLRAFQQLNVQHDKYGWIPMTSMLMAVCEVTIVTAIVKAGFGWVVIPLGLGGATGAILAMLIHKRLRK